MSQDEYVKTVRNAVDLLASKGATAGEIADFFRVEGVSGSQKFNDCPIYNWLRRQISADGEYDFYVGIHGLNLEYENAVRVYRGDYYETVVAAVELPQHLLDFIDAHDRRNAYGLDPCRSVEGDEIQ